MIQYISFILKHDVKIHCILIHVTSFDKLCDIQSSYSFFYEMMS